MNDAEHTGRATDDPVRQLLRQTIATLAYRAGTPLREVPDGFSEIRVASPNSKSPGS